MRDAYNNSNAKKEELGLGIWKTYDNDLNIPQGRVQETTLHLKCTFKKITIFELSSEIFEQFSLGKFSF